VKATEEPIIAYPPAFGGYPEAVASASPASIAVGPTVATAATAVAPSNESELIRFVVRCEGRWRVRSAPSLSSKVIGTVANGTVVFAQEEPSETSATDSTQMDAPVRTVAAEEAAAPAEAEAGTGIGSLWVRVSRFEAQEPMGVSEIKRDTASGGVVYCLRRNAVGYGLYKAGVEALDGPLLTLPEHLSTELRSDAHRAAAEKSDDVSLTWKLLGAAESVGNFFRSTMSMGDDEGGVSEDMKPQVRRRPEEIFEVRQREQLKKAAGTLKRVVQKLISKGQAAPGACPEDLTAGLPKEIGRRFARLRAALSATSTVSPLVVSHQPAQASDATAAAMPGSSEDVLDPPLSGGIVDLERFQELLGRLERTGGWPELGNELRQEVSNFSSKHSRDLEEFANRLGKAAVQDRRQGASPPTLLPVEGILGSPPGSPQGGSRRAPDESLFGEFQALPAPATTPSPKAFKTTPGGLPFLPPPPPPRSGVSTGQLI